LQFKGLVLPHESSEVQDAVRSEVHYRHSHVRFHPGNLTCHYLLLTYRIRLRAKTAHHCQVAGESVVFVLNKQRQRLITLIHSTSF